MEAGWRSVFAENRAPAPRTANGEVTPITLGRAEQPIDFNQLNSW